jgi:hypothetical protein
MGLRKFSSFFGKLNLSAASILLILIIFSPVKSFSFTSEPDSSPAFLSAISDQDGKVPVYWFKPGIEPEEQIYDDGTKEIQFYFSDEWYENCAAEKFVSPVLPFLLLKSKIFISHQGRPGDTLYNPADSFFITINQNNQRKPGQAISEPVYAKASGNGTPEGEWVETEHNLLISDVDTFWVVFHWLKDTPSSPLIGADNSANLHRSYKGWKKDGYWQWSEWNYNLMIRCLTLTNDTPSSLMPDGYNLYRADTSDFPVSSEYFLKNFLADSFYYLDSQVTNGKSYYYKLTATYSGQESGSPDEAEATPQNPASLQVDSDSLEISLPPGENKEEYLHLTNTGGISLEYQIKLELSLDDSTSGTDSYGYTWTDNFTRKSLEYGWVDITSRGTLINAPGDHDKVYGPIRMNFPFPFYGNSYDTLWISTTGVLSFYPWDLRFINQSLPCEDGYFRLIAPFWSNLVLIDSSRIYLFQSPDSIVVSFIHIKHFKSGNLYTFQVILTKEGSIDFQYKISGQSSDSLTVGIQNEDGTIALLISFNQNFLEDSLRVRIEPPYLFFSPVKGKINPAENLPLKLLFDSQFLSSGLYKGVLKFYAQDKNHLLNPLSIPVILKVDTTTSVDNETEPVPFAFELGQNYPNPFNPSTTIPFRAGSQGHVARSPVRTTLIIYNILGQKVKTLVDEDKLPGNYQVIWDGRDRMGNQVSSGIYFYQLKAGNYKETKKMSLLR